MAFRAYRPYKPDFRSINKLRGRTADPSSISSPPPPNFEPYNSIYQKDYLKGQNNAEGRVHNAEENTQKQGSGNKNFKIRNAQRKVHNE